jgi:hypothetical protein
LIVAAIFGQYLWGLRHGGWLADVEGFGAGTVGRWGSQCVWLEPGEHLAVTYDVTIRSGSLDLFLSDSSPWRMGSAMYGHLAIPASGQGTWRPGSKPGWVRLGVWSQGAPGFYNSQSMKYSVRWRVERTP